MVVILVIDGIVLFLMLSQVKYVHENAVKRQQKAVNMSGGTNTVSAPSRWRSLCTSTDFDRAFCRFRSTWQEKRSFEELSRNSVGTCILVVGEGGTITNLVWARWPKHAANCRFWRYGEHI